MSLHIKCLNRMFTINTIPESFVLFMCYFVFYSKAGNLRRSRNRPRIVGIPAWSSHILGLFGRKGSLFPFGALSQLQVLFPAIVYSIAPFMRFLFVLFWSETVPDLVVLLNRLKVVFYQSVVHSVNRLFSWLFFSIACCFYICVSLSRRSTLKVAFLNCI